MEKWDWGQPHREIRKATKRGYGKEPQQQGTGKKKKEEQLSLLWDHSSAEPSCLLSSLCPFWGPSWTSLVQSRWLKVSPDIQDFMLAGDIFLRKSACPLLSPFTFSVACASSLRTPMRWTDTSARPVTSSCTAWKEPRAEGGHLKTPIWALKLPNQSSPKPDE